MQKLVLPINNARITAGYKSKVYSKRFKTEHYGFDLVSVDGDTAVYSPGEGVVISSGLDGKSSSERCGLCLVIVFPDVIEPSGTKTRGVACRIYHMSSIAVLPGQMVRKGQLLGQYGKTGAMVIGKHLHIEFDYDIAYPQFAYGVSAGGNIIKAGTVETSIPPHKILHRESSQQITARLSDIDSGWVKEEEIKLEECEPSHTDEAECPHRESLEQLLSIVKNICGRCNIPA